MYLNIFGGVLAFSTTVKSKAWRKTAPNGMVQIQTRPCVFNVECRFLKELPKVPVIPT